MDLSSFGPTTLAPIGYVAHGRSGDKSSNVNIGLFVRHEDEYDWLRSLLTVDKMKKLLRDEYKGKAIDRYEFPGVFAVSRTKADSRLYIIPNESSLSHVLEMR